MVLTQLEIPIETVLHLAALCTRENVPLMLDPAPAHRLPEELLLQVSWFTPNESEATFFLADRPIDSDAVIASALLSDGPLNVVLKLGSRGAYLASGVERAREAPFSAGAVDTTAAGDAFNGAFATSLCIGKTPAEAVRFASAAAAVSVTRSGAQSAMPEWAEVQRLIESNEPVIVKDSDRVSGERLNAGRDGRGPIPAGAPLPLFRSV